MMKSIFNNILLVGVFLLHLILFSCSSEKRHENDFEERAKVAMRAIGNELLLSNGDSTSVVQPVIAIENSTFKLAFENSIAFDPNVLHTSVRSNFERAELPKAYLVEVLQCSDGEVAYSYEVRQRKENSIIPCGGRLLPENCYTVQVYFKNKQIVISSAIWFYVLVALVLLFLVFVFFSRYIAWRRSDSEQEVTRLGLFKFYPEQNVLLKEAEEISLSKKECELLTILVAYPNQVVKREELTKRVWEDNGVIVGRSLDTYISKLRKKLQDDDSIKITNVHGVGYKLEVDLKS